MSQPLLPIASPHVLAAALADEAVLLDLASKRYFQLNATATEIWNGLAAGDDRDVIIERLVRDFVVSPADAGRAVDAFVDALQSSALVAER